MRFSQRKGIRPAEVPIQIESMDSGLRNGLWSAIALCFLDVVRHDYNHTTDGCSHGVVLKRLWHHYFKKPLDEYPDRWSEFVDVIKRYFFNCEWHQVYDFIEEMIASFENNEDSKKITERMVSFMNNVMERDNCAYRIIDGVVSDLTDKHTIASIETAANQEKFKGASEHIKTSIALLFDRSNPDYRNSIKESISAVESACNDFIGEPDATLGQAIKRIEAQGHIHPAMKDAMSKLYGYTSDESGIRHAITGDVTVSKEDAQYMLSVCCAFINYIKAKCT